MKDNDSQTTHSWAAAGKSSGQYAEHSSPFQEPGERSGDWVKDVQSILQRGENQLIVPGMGKKAVQKGIRECDGQFSLDSQKPAQCTGGCFEKHK
jgi:hypothetical protein